MLMLPSSPTLSRLDWLLLGLFTLMINLTLVGAIIYVSEPKAPTEMAQSVRVRLSDVLPIPAEEPEEPPVFKELTPPQFPQMMNTTTSFNTAMIPELTSSVIVPTVLPSTFHDTSVFNLTEGLISLDSLASFSSTSVLEARPLTQIAPIYPSHALARGIEGKVTLEFSVNSQGAPYNITVMAEQPAGYFKQATLKAFSRWRFPVDSHLSDNTRYQYTITYKIDK